MFAYYEINEDGTGVAYTPAIKCQATAQYFTHIKHSIGETDTPLRLPLHLNMQQLFLRMVRRRRISPDFVAAN
jgi:hypothetical protein